MNFASPYVFNNAAETESYEVVSDDEFVGGMEFSDSGSDDESSPQAALALKAVKPSAPPPPSGDFEDKSASSEGSLQADGAGNSSVFNRVRGFFGRGGSTKSDGSGRAHSSSSHAQAHRHSSKPSKMHHWKSADSADQVRQSELNKKGRRRVFRRADTNVVSIRFDTLKTPSSMHAGEVILCSECEAIMSHVSRMQDDGPDKVWKCEFCGNRNVVEIEEEEKPTADDVTYLVEPALSTSAAGTSGRDESIVIFCIDISGSMTITTELCARVRQYTNLNFCTPKQMSTDQRVSLSASTLDSLMAVKSRPWQPCYRKFSKEDSAKVKSCLQHFPETMTILQVPGHQELRGSSTLRRLRRENTMEGDQRLPSERRNVTYISRLQAVQAAVDHQLGEMVREFPHRRIGVVTFSYEVNVIGDGTVEEVTVSGQKLADQDELRRIGSELPCPNPVKDTRASLGEKIFKLEEGGSTALGPALIVALSMASQQPGSKVIICTDGKSNEGVGKVENLTDSDPDPAEFYESVAQTAKEKGVSMSVVTIKGTDCKLIQLGKLADKTGGQVNIVDPLKLTEEFSNVLADQIIATNVVATFILHRGLYIGKEENEESKERRVIGNVRADHEISFEYGVRRKKVKEVSEKPSALDRISEVHTSMEGEEYPTTPTGDSTEGKTLSAAVTEMQQEGTAASTEGETPEGASATAGITIGGCIPSSGGDGAGETIPDELPFQLQITYTDVNGMKALRVLTQKKPVTSDRGVAEKDADLNVLGVHTERKASELALLGDYTGSRAVALTHQRLGWRASRVEHSSGERSRRKTYHRAFSRVKTVENTITAKQMQEVSTYGRTHSDDEDEDCDQKLIFDSAAMMPSAIPNLNRQSSDAPRAQSKKWTKQKMRSEEIDDDMAEMIYQSRASSTASTVKKSKK